MRQLLFLSLLLFAQHSYCSDSIFTATIPLHYVEYIYLHEEVELLLGENVPHELSDILEGNYNFKAASQIDAGTIDKNYPIVWGRIRIANPHEQAIGMNINFTMSADTIWLYKVTRNQIKNSWSTGTKFQISEKLLPSVRNIIPVYFPPEDTSTYYFKIRTMPRLIPYYNVFWLASPRFQFARHTSQGFFFGLYAGAMVLLGVISIYFFFIFRAKILINFAFLAWVFALHFTDFYNLLEVHILNHSRFLLLWGSDILLFGLYFSIFAISSVYTKFRSYKPVLYWIMFGVTMMIGAVLLVGPLITGNQNIPILITTYLLLVWIIGMIVSLILMVKAGQHAARIFLASISFLAVSGLLTQLRSLGIIPDNFITRYSPQLASLIFSGLIFYGIFERIKTIREERRKAQENALESARENERIVRNQNIILEKKVDERTNELRMEKNKSEQLLLNILPQETAEELKLNGKAKPRHYDMVSVMFLDFVSFSSVATHLTPTELVEALDELFGHFDKIIEKYRIEKIKTIGDAYLCAAGLPAPSPTHAPDIVNAAIEFQNYLAQANKRRGNLGLPYFEARIGIHSGPVVAGIVGIKKFAYDLWGDTVNIAARMEQNSEPGKINISHGTYELIRDQFDCSPRGRIEAKNKGMLRMYFVEKMIVDSRRRD